MLPRRALAGLCALLLAGGAAGDEIAAPEAVVVRVLLLEGRDSVRVAGGAAGAGIRVRPSRDGLVADGRARGRLWRLRGDDVLRVGDWRVRGDLVLSQVDGALRVVNHVPLEDYVAGTVGREVYPGWADEMLKAQAVVARSYALHQRARHGQRDHDLAAGVDSQVYGGVTAETPAVRAAAAATRGEYLSWGGQPILAVYHSASGGRTASAEEVWGRPTPYLISVPVEDEEDSPDTYWRASVSGTTLGRALDPLGIGVGRVRTLRVVERSPSGRARLLEVRGEVGTASIEARALRRALGLGVIRSTLFEIRTAADGFVFVGSGHGHGVGMSQWGAQAMARRGASYREILAKFYPGTRRVQVAR